jgi:hypothetical protein
MGNIGAGKISGCVICFCVSMKVMCKGYMERRRKLRKGGACVCMVKGFY